MKTRYKIAIIGVPLILVVGFFLWVSWIFVAFEHRENHNGVGYNAFRKSILRHVKQGPNRLSDLRSYEGTWWFRLTDQTSHSYRVTIGRDAFVDARDMATLKSGRFALDRVAGQKLKCENNFGEAVEVFLKLENFDVSEYQPSSINALLTAANIDVAKFGESLPMRFEVDDTGIQEFSDGLRASSERESCGCGEDEKPLELASSITCLLD